MCCFVSTKAADHKKDVKKQISTAYRVQRAEGLIQMWPTTQMYQKEKYHRYSFHSQSMHYSRYYLLKVSTKVDIYIY